MCNEIAVSGAKLNHSCTLLVLSTFGNSGFSPGTKKIVTARNRVFLITLPVVLLVSFWAAAPARYLCSPLGSQGLARMLERSFPPILPGQCGRADAIVVLSGTGPPRVIPLRAFETPNRMDGALDLWKAERAPYLVLTTPEGVMNRVAAIRAGVLQQSIILVGPAGSTAEEIRAILALAKEKHWHRLILVTSAFHMRRALLLCRFSGFGPSLGLDIVPYPVDWQQMPVVFRQKKPNEPNGFGRELFLRCVKEMVGWAIATV